MMSLILASASPRRQALLDQINISYQVQPANIDESIRPNESAEQLVVRLAKEKASYIAHSYFNNQLVSIPILGADTLGVYNGVLLNKPRHKDDALTMLSLMSGQWHNILTAVSLYYKKQQKTLLQTNRVKFRILQASEIEAYWNTQEPQDKAGSYAIQGIGAQFIERIEGSYSGIMGLPLFETCQLLNEFGLSTIES